MRRRPSRTFKSDLSDDLLLIFDALFDCNDTLPSLLRENYGSFHNVPYTHNLDDREVEEAVRELMSAGLLASRVRRGLKRSTTFYGLTEAGGRLWEVEREPRWDRFCKDFHGPDEGGGPVWMEVLSPSEGTLWEFLDVTRRCHFGLGQIDPSGANVTRHADYRLVPWKTFPAVYELRAPVTEERVNITDWGVYERGRTWWRCIMELGGLAA